MTQRSTIAPSPASNSFFEPYQRAIDDSAKVSDIEDCNSLNEESIFSDGGRRGTDLTAAKILLAMNTTTNYRSGKAFRGYTVAAYFIFRATGRT